MSESSESFALDDNRLGLFDVSLEDDCLYTTSSPPSDFDFSDDLLENGLSLNLMDSQSLHTLVGGVDAGESPQPLESSEPEETKQNNKYNLRKSLAWDSAFFTSAGVLEPDELSTMMGQTEKRGMLPGIREELERSTDSLSTLASEGLTMENLDGELFGDIRASIQKSSGSSDVASTKSRSGTRMGYGKAATPAKQSPKKLDQASETKPKPKVSSKKADVVIPGSRKTLKHTSPIAQAPQPLATKRDPASLSKPPKIAARISISTAGKRAPLGNTRVKLEKDKTKGSASNSANMKDLTGRVKIPISGGSRNIVSKLSPPLRSSLSSTKTESVGSSSFDCSESISSDGGSSRSSLNSFTRKVDPRAGGGILSSSLIAKATSRISSKSRNLSTIPHPSPSLRSVAKHSPTISPASSVSEWSAESISLSPTSTLNKRSNCSRSSIDTASCGDPYEDDESSQVSDSQSHSSETSAAGTLGGQSMKTVFKENGGLLTESAKPSGLRLPSPKIGFFDGVRSSSRNSNGSSQTKPGAAPSGLPRPGGVPHGKPGNLQTAKAAATPVRSPRVGTQQQTLSSSKSKSPLSNNQDPSIAVPKVGGNGGNLLRNAKRSPGISPRVQSKTSCPGNSVEKNPKPVKVTPIDEHHTPIVLPSTKKEESYSLEEEKVAAIEYEHKASLSNEGDAGAKIRENSPSQKVALFEQQLREASAKAPSVHEVRTGNEEVAEVSSGS